MNCDARFVKNMNYDTRFVNIIEPWYMHRVSAQIGYGLTDCRGSDEIAGFCRKGIT